MPFLKETNFQGQRVFVRCDFNVPIEKGEVADDFKIQQTLATLNYLKNQGAKLILASHLGRPQEIKKRKERIKKFSLKPVHKRLEELLKEKVRFSQKIVGPKPKREMARMKPGEILLLENLRFEKGETRNDEKFAKALAELADIYVSEAFGVCHRSHASIVSLPRFLPHFKGLNLEKEIEVLSRLSKAPKRPLVVIIGGAKIASKIKVIEKFLAGADHLLFGGKIANVILRVKGMCPGQPWPEEEIVKKIEKLNITDLKVHLPVDVLASPDEAGELYVRETGPANVRKEEDIFDIGKETVNSFGQVIGEAKTIFWSGALGVYENEKFSQGTREIAQRIVRNYDAFKVIGGGDTIRAARKFNLLDRFSFVSTGGSAMLSFLTGEQLPGLKALEE